MTRAMLVRADRIELLDFVGYYSSTHLIIGIRQVDECRLCFRILDETGNEITFIFANDFEINKRKRQIKNAPEVFKPYLKGTKFYNVVTDEIRVFPIRILKPQEYNDVIKYK